jgi:hypothetical protein
VPRHGDLWNPIADPDGTRGGRNKFCSPLHNHTHSTRSGRNDLCSIHHVHAHAGRDDTGSQGQYARRHPHNCSPRPDTCARFDGTVPGHHRHRAVPCVHTALPVMASASHPAP